MPYCPKCGVEADSDIKSCPLCGFKLPLIDDEEAVSAKFPEYKDRLGLDFTDIKRRTFFALSVSALINIVYFTVSRIISGRLSGGYIFQICFIVSALAYLFVFSGILSNKKVLIFLFIINTVFISFLIDISVKGLGWFIPVFLPATALGSVILIVTAVIIRYKKKKDFSVIFNVAAALSAFFAGTEAIVSNYVYRRIKLSWSIFISAELIVLSLLLLFFYYKMPSKIRDKVKMKIHI